MSSIISLKTEDEELDGLLDKISSLEEQENTIELNVKKLEEANEFLKNVKFPDILLPKKQSTSAVGI